MTTLARLLFAFLIAALATPAVALPLCHLSADEAPVALGGHHGDAHQPAEPTPSKQAVQHQCIGCIDPGSMAPPGLTARLLPARIPAQPTILIGGPLDASPPATPPPRSLL